MTLQQLKYVIEVAERGSITEAAKSLFIAQPSLSAAIRELEEEMAISIFVRKSRGILLTPEGAEFLGYARQVVQQAALIEEKYIAQQAVKQRFSVSTQHYSFTSSAFIDLVRAHSGQAYEFTLREGKTYDTISDVKNLRSEMGVIYLSTFNEAVISKSLLFGFVEQCFNGGGVFIGCVVNKYFALHFDKPHTRIVGVVNSDIY